MKQGVEIGAPATPEPAAPFSTPIVAGLPLGVAEVEALQRTAGNRRTTAMLLRQVRRGMAAHLEFLRERTQRLSTDSTLTPERIRLEEQALRRMNEALRRNPRLADREVPIVLYSRIARELMAGPEGALGPLETPATPPAEEAARRLAPFEALAGQLRAYRSRTTRLINQPWEQRVWLVRENQAVQDVFDELARRLMNWAMAHVRDTERTSAIVVLRDLAADREIQTLFRYAQIMPLDSEAFSTRPELSGWTVAFSILWGFLPVIGDLTDLAQATSGIDAWDGHPLTPEERGILLLGAVLPFVAGSALRRAGEGATEVAGRLAASSGRTAAEIAQVARAADVVAADQAVVRRAIERIRRGQRVAPADAARLREVAGRVAATAAEGASRRAGTEAVGRGGERAAETATGAGRGGETATGAGRGGERAAETATGAGRGGGRALASVAEVRARAVEAVSRLTHGVPLTEQPIAPVLRQLRSRATEGSNGEILRHIETIWTDMQNPEVVGEIIADIWAEAHRMTAPNYTEAVVRLSERATGGARVVTIPPNPPGAMTGLNGGDFFNRYAGTAQRFLDRNIDSLHGHSTHLIQDLIVDRALRRSGLRAEQFRALLPRAVGRGSNVTFGDLIWRTLWDAERGGAINEPEGLMAAIRQVLAGIE